MKPRHLIQNEKGFTLVEIIAVLVVLGILAAVAIPKYLSVASDARNKAAVGQIGEVKGRLSTALGGYMIANDGTVPATGAALITYTNTLSTDACPTTATTEGDFEFICSSAAKVITITVSKVQGTGATASGTFTVP